MGEMLIAATVVMTLVAALVSIINNDSKQLATVKSLFLAGALTGTVAAAALVFMLVTHDYRVEYVRAYADRTMSLGYLVTALWGGHQGSLLFWAMLQSWFAAAMAYWYAEKDIRVLRVALSIMGGIAIFFWLLVLTQSNPFSQSGDDPQTSFGMNPLLRNPYMVFHPPTLFIGFAGVSVPLAAGLAVLIRGRSDNDWLQPLRPWALFAFIFLSIGNILGMVWAYEELGWGGYWGWDPVENASLLPWFTATALLHSMMAQRRWGILKRWNLSLIVVTFMLTIFGTFLTRSGIIQSVHAFADATEGPYLLGMIGLVLAAFLYLIILRFGVLSPENTYEMWSRQWMFELANWLFSAAVLFVGVATMWPFFLGVFKGEQATMTPAFFNTWMVPIGLAIFATIGACSVIPVKSGENAARARRSTLIQVAVLFAVALGAGLQVGSRSELGGMMAYAPAISVMLIVFVVGVLLLQMRRSYLSRNTTQLGGQLVHLSMAVMYVGFTGAGFVSEKTANVGPGEFMYMEDVKVTFLGMRTDANFEREAVFADLEVIYPSGRVEVVSPARYLYHSHPKQPTSEVNIRTHADRDLFFILGETDFRQGRAVIKVLSNPLVVWIWIGGIWLVIGALIAMSRGRFRELIEMKPALRRRLIPLGVGTVGTVGVLSLGVLWKGAPGAVALLGAFWLAAAFGLLANGVLGRKGEDK
ncbi:MAG: heme lyase CcmF/NrfE family subunit [Deltaproteobacteria bacterium]|nr:heme lyase CcmF/NrfE family subunit [Deltaproteobacteria bacterium]